MEGLEECGAAGGLASVLLGAEGFLACSFPVPTKCLPFYLLPVTPDFEDYVTTFPANSKHFIYWSISFDLTFW